MRGEIFFMLVVPPLIFVALKIENYRVTGYKTSLWIVYKTSLFSGVPMLLDIRPHFLSKIKTFIAQTGTKNRKCRDKIDGLTMTGRRWVKILKFKI